VNFRLEPELETDREPELELQPAWQCAETDAERAKRLRVAAAESLVPPEKPLEARPGGSEPQPETPAAETMLNPFLSWKKQQALGDKARMSPVATALIRKAERLEAEGNMPGALKAWRVAEKQVKIERAGGHQVEKEVTAGRWFATDKRGGLTVQGCDD
jgi:hypothetical protein